MRSEEFNNICEAVQHGQEKHVKHIITHQHGTILSCEEGFFEVDSGGEHKSWSKENCKEED